ncbi:MAG: hypothetical protein HOC71_03555 [Candidatus Latescibacteria bacterium]|jgi:poly(beta-D-mannuronate) lyase|nr:hypothetical protein [Candidatus Latescibacterota bacterium]
MLRVKNVITCILCIAITICFVMGCGKNTSKQSRVIQVTNEEEFKTAIATAKPGAVIEVADGDYKFDDSPLHISLKATNEEPILIRAKNLGKARFTGEYAMLIEESSYITIEGFTFNNRALKNAVKDALPNQTYLESYRDPAPKWGSLVLLNSDHCRLTSLFIKMEEKEGFTPEMIEMLLPRTHWINLTGGEYNRVDHCWMKDKVNAGLFICIGTGEHHFRIDHNHFAGRPRGNGNGFEVIRLGTRGLSPLYGLIEYNLFENCDGEGEIVSVKSDVLIIRNNTFTGCRGSLVIRCANDVTVEYNFFLNPKHKKGVGGVRIHGNNNNIINNYFGDLTGRSILTYWGDFDNQPYYYDVHDRFFSYDRRAKAFAYPETGRAHLAFNTFAYCASFLHLGTYNKGKGYVLDKPPKDWTITNNLVVSTDKQFIRGEGESGFRWMGNIFWNPGDACVLGRELPEEAVRVVDPKLTKSDDGLWRISKDSPAVNSTGHRRWQHLLWENRKDMDGQERDINSELPRPAEWFVDVGADEYSDAPIINRPLTPGDVGPNSL